jgi:hypothetical protein
MNYKCEACFAVCYGLKSNYACWLQHRISETLSTIEEKIEAEESKKTSLEVLFKTLLSLLMTGKMRVKDLDV